MFELPLPAADAQTLAMRHNIKKNPTPVSIKGAIRKEFSFLANYHGFSEVPTIPASDEVYSEVHFEKKAWRIAVLTTAHVTQVSLELISPDVTRGFLSHMLEPEIGKPSRNEFDVNIFNDIKYKAQTLLKYGSRLLNGETIDFEYILEDITIKQQQWAIDSGILAKT